MFMDILIYAAVLAVGVGVGLYIGHKKVPEIQAVLDRVTDTRESVQSALAQIRAIVKR